MSQHPQQSGTPVANEPIAHLRYTASSPAAGDLPLPSASPPTSSEEHAVNLAPSADLDRPELNQRGTSESIGDITDMGEVTIVGRNKSSLTMMESHTFGGSSLQPSPTLVPSVPETSDPDGTKHFTLAVALDNAAFAADEDVHPDGEAPVYTHLFHQVLPGPPCVRNILGNELCERFSWYGLRAILVLYFHEKLGWSESSSISVYSYIGALAYFMPLLGGYVSDAKLGKYNTIISFSGIYVIGGVLLALAAYEELVWLSLLGLVFIGIGTGGIKPCVSSFGADQFTQRRVRNEKEAAEREHQVSSFFHFFYFAINLGSVGSFIFTPLLRQHFGYWVAFGVPAVLLTFATFIFWTARKDYFRAPPAGSMLASLQRTFVAAYKNRRNEPPAAAVAEPEAALQRAPNNWIDKALADPNVTADQVDNAKSLWRVLPIFAVLPVFWMLFDQQSSTWTIQAEDMNLYGMEAEQVGVANPVLIMLLLPLFDRVIYPAIARWGYDFTPLRRMGLGMIISVVAFLLSAGVQYLIDAASTENSVSVFLQLPQILLISIAEILVSVTGLEFAYVQATPQLKSSISALFLTTSAVGDLLTGVLFDALSEPLGMAWMLVFFSGLMALNFLLFLVVAKHYQKESAVEKKAAPEEVEDEVTKQKKMIAIANNQASVNTLSSGAEPNSDAAPVPVSDIELVPVEQQ